MKSLLLLIICFYACTPNKISTQPVDFSDGIQTDKMSNVGIDAAMIYKMNSQIVNGTYPNIHSVLISRNKKLVFEKYYTGKDQNWGRDLGITNHAIDSLHDIRSISKSIVSACIGLAIAQGKIKSVDQKVFEFFPEFKRLDTGIKSLLTIKHLLTMTPGLVWNEDIPYTDPENSEIKMIRSANPVEYVLSQPMEYAPGLHWKYNGGATQLLASIIERTTGKKIDEFANQFLFQALNIKSYEWRKYPKTELPAAASGLRLTSRDLLKFGLLYAYDGMFNDKQILPPQWVKESIQSHAVRTNTNSNEKSTYGYQFWLWSGIIINKPVTLIMGIGNGDQRIFVDKENDLIVVITAGNYDKWDIKNNSHVLLDNLYIGIF